MLLCSVTNGIDCGSGVTEEDLLTCEHYQDWTYPYDPSTFGVDEKGRPNEAFAKFLSFARCFINNHATNDGQQWDYNGYIGQEQKFGSFVSTSTSKTEILTYNEQFESGCYVNKEVTPEIHICFMLDYDCTTILDTFPQFPQEPVDMKNLLLSMNEIIYTPRDGRCSYFGISDSKYKSLNGYYDPILGKGNISGSEYYNGQAVAIGK